MGMAPEPLIREGGETSAAGASARSTGVDLTVLVPVYNEADNMEPLLSKLKTDLAPLPLRAEILVVDDGSTDETPAILAPYRDAELSRPLLNLAERGGRVIIPSVHSTDRI